MIGDGLKLMVIGMGYVVLFLTVMVLVMMIAAKWLKPFAHLVEEKVAAAPRKAPKGKDSGDNKNLIAAAIAAVHMHRNKK